MITSLLAAAVALAVGLPIFVLGERIRERGGAAPGISTPNPPERTSREQIR